MVTTDGRILIDTFASDRGSAALERQSSSGEGSRSSAARRRVRPRGFTLVELLVVIAVIAVLAGVLFPVLAQVREQARRSTCLSQLQQLGRAHLLYLQDWDEQFPAWLEEGPWRPGPWGPRRYWTECFQPYLRSQGLFQDPGAWWSGAPEDGVKLADYALLTWGPGGERTPDNPYFRWAGPPLTLAQVRRPTETLNLTDGWTTTAITWGVVLRHSGGTNASFLDGHVRWLAVGELRRVDTEGGVYWRHYAAADL
jgi:prepilin-type N-terminal cleavage/methylation domain-containing protein/prepilin-type processing-associated H-X9-DG protein